MHKNLDSKKLRICYCGSGSGGHLKPLVALYNKTSLQVEHQFFLCSSHPFDQLFVKEWGVSAYFFKYTRISQGNFLFVLWKLFYSICESIQLFRSEKPNLLIGTGGYACFPAYLVCILFSIDFYIIEPNSICGKVNRWFQSYAKAVFTHFSKVDGLKKNTQIVQSGVPLVYDKPKKGVDEKILIFGASLGARSINVFMQKYFEAYGGDDSSEYIWITGKSDFEEFNYFNQHKNIQVLSFVKDMQCHLENAKLVIARSGAGCIADVEYFKIP
ncbi:glycosyltransferase, partial [bacterium]|nr:glycosyltransferase [bacterium]